MSEYWIHEDGGVDFADGDVGDYNHEGIVISQVQRGIVEKCEAFFRVRNKWGHSFANDDYVDWDKFKQALAQEYTKQNPKAQPWLDNDPDKIILAALRTSGVKKAEWACAEGQGDARDYAMQWWGWKTYRNGNVDTWKMTRKDLEAIIRGLEEISEQENWSDKRFYRMGFYITVFSSGRHIAMTVPQMEQWLSSPVISPTYEKPQFDYLTQQASRQVRDIEYEKLDPAYKRPGVHPFGDSVLSFRAFVESHHD
jgi:hypothetical protein